ncbi:endonuclease/exonuclease/phosphatase family protein [Rhizobium binae]|uniref:endonuclease/exonuclease/phosphatase family protein n=1 Tax=Rhizobium binae TaxID=1138190 RepID=UPI003CCFE5FF
MGFLQIASWNIEHLSGAPRADRRQSAFALADHIEMSGIDVIALQEVYLTPADEEVRLAAANTEPGKNGTPERRSRCRLLSARRTPRRPLGLRDRAQPTSRRQVAAVRCHVEHQAPKPR